MKRREDEEEGEEEEEEERERQGQCCTNQHALHNQIIFPLF